MTFKRKIFGVFSYQGMEKVHASSTTTTGERRKGIFLSIY
ncbi:hypothetical protein CSUI_009173, partial [Cystoisospora suis]